MLIIITDEVDTIIYQPTIKNLLRSVVGEVTMIQTLGIVVHTLLENLFQESSKSRMIAY